MNYNLTDPYEIAKFIKESKKSTPVKVYINGNLDGVDLENIEVYGSNNFYVLYGESEKISDVILNNKDRIKNFRVENDRRNSAIPMLDLLAIDARIEPGAIIRDKVIIGKNAVIMMGAVINIGAEIGEGSMVDMNAVIGARGKIGKRVHLGAGAVVAGVLEPPSKSPCEVGDDVMIGANSTILPGVEIGDDAIISAMTLVNKDVPAGAFAGGNPMKIIYTKEEMDKKNSVNSKEL